MARKTFTPEQITNKLREVEVLISQGANATEAKEPTMRLSLLFVGKHG